MSHTRLAFMIGALLFVAVRDQSTPRAPTLALLGATVIDGTGAPPLPNAAVIVENGEIRAVGPLARVRVPLDAERRDLAGLTLLPGLIDSHVHLSFALPQGFDFTRSDDPALTSVLADLLRNGVTSIRDVGDAYPWIVELARSI